MNYKSVIKLVLAFAVVFLIFSYQSTNTEAATKLTRYVDINSGTLTVRSGPGTKYKKVGSLKKYKKVTVYNQTKSGWSEIRYNKKKAYVSSDYLVNVNIKNSRKTYTLKDAKGKKYKVYMIGKNEIKAKAAYTDDWNMVWAGAHPGDTLYKGDYKLYLRKNGSNKITYTGHYYNNYKYNKTRQMVYSLPSKYKGQPDLFLFAETLFGNGEEATVYYVNKGKLQKIDTIAYTHITRPQVTGKNSYRDAGYYNGNGDWVIYSYKLNTDKGTFYDISYKTVNSISNWRKDWK